MVAESSWHVFTPFEFYVVVLYLWLNIYTHYTRMLTMGGPYKSTHQPSWFIFTIGNVKQQALQCRTWLACVPDFSGLRSIILKFAILFAFRVSDFSEVLSGSSSQPWGSEKSHPLKKARHHQYQPKYQVYLWNPSPETPALKHYPGNPSSDIMAFFIGCSLGTNLTKYENPLHIYEAASPIFAAPQGFFRLPPLGSQQLPKLGVLLVCILP